MKVVVGIAGVCNPRRVTLRTTRTGSCVKGSRKLFNCLQRLDASRA